MKNLKIAALALLSMVLLCVGNTASAAIDVSAASAIISGDGVAAVTTIGTAVIGLAGVAVVFKWAKAAIFG